MMKTLFFDLLALALAVLVVSSGPQALAQEKYQSHACQGHGCSKSNTDDHTKRLPPTYPGQAGPKRNAALANNALPRITKLISAVQSAGSPDQRRMATNELRDLLGQLGPDVIDAIDGGSGNGNKGLNYINSRLHSAGVGFEPILDPWTRHWLKMAKPGEIRGKRGGIRFSFRPYSEHTLSFLRSQGNRDTGMWGATFDGEEAYDFRESEDGRSVSNKLRALSRSMSGGSLKDVVTGLVGMMAEQPLPGGYALDVDLIGVPKEHHDLVRQALAGLEAQGATLKYSDAEKLIQDAKDSAKLNRRIDQLLSKPQAQWTDADWQEYKEVHRLYNQPR